MEKDFVVSELIGEGVAYTIMGICIVFLILVIIMFVIKAMALFSDSGESKSASPAPAAPAASDAPAAPSFAPSADETELIAVISAAVAASLGESAASVRIRSYKRLDGGAWNKAGRREVLENRF